MLTLLAFCVSQVRVVACPLSTVLGLAVSDAVGAAGGGGGGGGGGATFFLQAPSVRTAPRANMKTTHFVCLYLTVSSLESSRRPLAGAHKLR